MDGIDRSSAGQSMEARAPAATAHECCLHPKILAWRGAEKSGNSKLLWQVAWCAVGHKEGLWDAKITEMATAIGVSEQAARRAKENLVTLGAFVELEPGGNPGVKRHWIKDPNLVVTSQPPGILQDAQRPLVPDAIERHVRPARPSMYKDRPKSRNCLTKSAQTPAPVSTSKPAPVLTSKRAREILEINETLRAARSFGISRQSLRAGFNFETGAPAPKIPMIPKNSLLWVHPQSSKVNLLLALVLWPMGSCQRALL